MGITKHELLNSIYKLNKLKNDSCFNRFCNCMEFYFSRPCQCLDVDYFACNFTDSDYYVYNDWDINYNDIQSYQYSYTKIIF